MMNADAGLTPEESSLVQRIAGKVYHKYCPEGLGGTLSQEDLCHYGIIGLLQARKSYDAATGAPWLTFAYARIQGEMIDHLRKLPLVRLPQEVQQKVRALKQVHDSLHALGQEVTPERLAEKLGWKLDEVHDVGTITPTLVYMDDDGQEHGEERRPRGETMRSPALDPEKIYLQAELAELVNKCLRMLTPQNRLIVVGRFLEGLKLRELAATMGCTVENIRVRQNNSAKQLQECLASHGWPVSTGDDVLD